MIIVLMLAAVLGIFAGRELWLMKNKQLDADNFRDILTAENMTQKSSEPNYTKNPEADSEDATDTVNSEIDNGDTTNAVNPEINSEDITDSSNPGENAPDLSNPQNKDLFADYYGQAEELLRGMTLEEKVGQMFLVRFPESGVIEEIENEHPGGYILFGRDFKDETKSSILKKLEDCQNASKIRLILGVDEEGGTVVRVSAYEAFRSSRFLSPQQIWADGQLPAILEDSTEKSNLLKSIGLNMNLAPVADVPTKSSSFIYNRSYGRGAENTSIYVAQLIETMNRDGMISVMKHFPGYGDNVDTHTGIAIDERSYDVFENSDFLPFQSGIEAGGPCILVSHNIVKAMDADKPASLSKNVHDILRNELNFSGIIMTDDLAMDAVKSYAENGEAAIQAVLAGNDMIISSDFQEQKQEILNAVEQGRISEALIDEAVKRILAWKYMYEVIQ